MPDDSLSALQAEWLAQHDGASGDAFGCALEQEGRTSEAEDIYRQLIKSGYVVGYFDLAWLEHSRGGRKRARKLLQKYLAVDQEPDEQRDLVSGVLGHWIWDAKQDPDAENLLRAGLTAYPDSRSDLADLLNATGRSAEAEAVLCEGVAIAEVGSFIVLANMQHRPCGRSRGALPTWI